MSDRPPIPLHQADEVACTLADALLPYTPYVEVCGSIRRKRPLPTPQTVKDVELVLIRTPEVLKALDVWVDEGRLEKRQYVIKGKPQVRWGERTRFACYQGVPVDIFLADWDNLGYIRWLRTGPGPANQYMVARVKRNRDRGLVPWVIKGHLESEGQRYPLPNEYEVFRLFGLPYIPPQFRSEATYRQFFESPDYRDYRDLMRTSLPDIILGDRFAGRVILHTYEKWVEVKSGKKTAMKRLDVQEPFRVGDLRFWAKDLMQFYCPLDRVPGYREPFAYRNTIFDPAKPYKEARRVWVRDYLEEVAWYKSQTGRDVTFPALPRQFYNAAY